MIRGSDGLADKWANAIPMRVVVQMVLTVGIRALITASRSPSAEPVSMSAGNGSSPGMSISVSTTKMLPSRSAGTFIDSRVWSGNDCVFNTYAHVVKSVTISVLLALAFIFTLHVH